MLKDAFKHFVFLALFLTLLSAPPIIKAVNSPILTSPENNEILNKSPKLTWDFVGECVESGSCFVIEIDNTQDFSSKEKSSYTDKNSYSPQGLGEDTWYWRVKAKDKSEEWSEWSNVFKFSISENAPSPSLTPIPAASKTPQPTPTAKPSPKKSENVFEINTHVTEINSDEELEVNVKLITDDAGKIFYIKGAFKKADSSNYFGYTNFDDNWVVNSAKYLNQFKTYTNESGEWSGKLRIKPDSEDAGFDGTAEYILKAGRYTESGSGPIWSNEIKIKINEVEIPEEKAVTETEIEATEESEYIEEEITEIKPDYEFKIASVAGISQISDNTPLEPVETVVLEEKQINWMLVISGIATLFGTAGFTFYKLRWSSRG